MRERERGTMLLFFIPIAAASPLPSGGNSSALAAANCDPDYGWINGPEGSNKCYMYLKEVDILTTAVIRQIPTATLTATTPIAARTPMLVVEEHTTLASTGLRPNSAAFRTMDSWQSPPVRRSMT